MSNKEATRIITAFAVQAKHRIEMFDDGNTDSENVYNDPVFVDIIRRKLMVDDFHMECLFNDYDVSHLRLVDDLGHMQNLEIWTRPYGSLRPMDAHYKIIDDIDLVYLSRHEHGATTRMFQTLDFRNLGRFQRWCIKYGGSDGGGGIIGQYRQDKRYFRRFPSTGLCDLQ